MAKPTFHKLQLKVAKDKTQFNWNEQTISVITYLPIEKKINLIADVINGSADENDFQDAGKIDVYYKINILYYYTDLVFTDKQKKDIGKIYDSVITSGFMNEVLKHIPEEEQRFLDYILNVSIKDYYESRRNSIKGLLENMALDYSNLDFNATDIQKKLADPDNLKLLKGVMGELG